MAEVLSQNQIDMLLNSLLNSDTSADSGDTGGGGDDAQGSGSTGASSKPGELQEKLPNGEVRTKKVKDYDFRSPKLFTREQLKLLYTIYENYCRIVSSHMTMNLQTFVACEIIEVEEQQYYEYNNALPDSVLVGLVDFDVKDENNISENLVMMEMAKEIGFCCIDRFLGGSGEPLEEDREYTEIELSVLQHLFKGMVGLMKNVWADHLDISPKLMKMETNSRILQGISADENVVIVVMLVTVNETQGKMTLCIPASTLNLMFKKREIQSKRRERRGDQHSEELRRARILQQINESDLTVKGILGEVTVLSKDVVELQVGDIIMLNKPEDSYVDIAIEDTVWFKGELGIYNKRKAMIIREKLKRGSDSAI